jgi:hypothetical protein
MSMLTLNGIIQNVFTKPDYTDKESGEVRKGAPYAQILCENQLETGEKRLDMVTLKVRDFDEYKALEGRRVRIPVGALVNGHSIQYYSLKTEPHPETA